MRKLFVDKVTGFRVKDPTVPILIRDSRGIVFYDTLDLVPKVKYFNLPVGEYLVDSGYFTVSSEPRHYPLANMPEPERNRKKPYDFEIQFMNNPNKCSIIWDEKRIVFDSSFMSKPKPEIDFVLFHEIGHSLYETEKFADLYASNMMKIRGYNPSQISWAHLNSLSPQQYERKKFINKALLETL